MRLSCAHLCARLFHFGFQVLLPELDSVAVNYDSSDSMRCMLSNTCSLVRIIGPSRVSHESIALHQSAFGSSNDSYTWRCRLSPMARTLVIFGMILSAVSSSRVYSSGSFFAPTVPLQAQKPCCIPSSNSPCRGGACPARAAASCRNPDREAAEKCEDQTR
jgi:hypothetical protein